MRLTPLGFDFCAMVAILRVNSPAAELATGMLR
jgi:hypothetical protein